MKKLLKPFLTLILCVFSVLGAQNTQIDSLKIKLKTAKTDTIKVNLLLQLSEVIESAKFDEKINAGKDAFFLSAKLVSCQE